MFELFSIGQTEDFRRRIGSVTDSGCFPVLTTSVKMIQRATRVSPVRRLLSSQLDSSSLLTPDNRQPRQLVPTPPSRLRELDWSCLAGSQPGLWNVRIGCLCCSSWSL